jgi:hypothetical protein
MTATIAVCERVWNSEKWGKSAPPPNDSAAPTVTTEENSAADTEDKGTAAK